MFEGRFEQRTQPQPPESEKTEMTERVRGEVADYVVETLCATKNALASLDAKLDMLSFGPDKDEAAIQACQIERRLIEEVLNYLESRGRAIGALT